MALLRLLLSLGVAVVMCAWVRSEDWAVVCQNDTVVTSFNLSSFYDNKLGECNVTNYTCYTTTNNTLQQAKNVQIYACSCNTNFSRNSSCFLSANESNSCVANVTLGNTLFICCLNGNVQIVLPDLAVQCHQNATCSDNVTCHEIVTSQVNVTSPVETSTRTTVTTENDVRPTGDETLEDEDVKVKIILGVILPAIFILAAVFILVCLHRKYNFIKMLQNFRGRSDKGTPKPQASTQAAPPDLSQYSSLNPTQHLFGQDNYSYASLTLDKGGALNAGTQNENGDASHPVISKEFSSKSYEYVSGIVGQGEGHFDKADGSGGISNGSVRSDYTYELVTKVTAGREQPNSPISCVYSNASTEADYSKQEKMNFSEL